MKIIVGCEKSHRIAGALRKHGHDAWSCDILSCEVNTPYHIQDDILKHLDDGWDVGIFHPDCTYLANSGVRWLYHDGKIDIERYKLMIKACEFFNTLLNAKIPYIAIENPIQHKYARKFIRKPDEIIQPWWFGEGESKATCLWLKNLPPLMATYVHTERYGKTWLTPPGPTQKEDRARTYQGIADAIAYQWGNYLINIENKMR